MLPKMYKSKVKRFSSITSSDLAVNKMLIYNLFFISKQCYGCFLASKGPTTIAEVVNCRNQDAVSSQIPLDPEGFSNARI